MVGTEYFPFTVDSNNDGVKTQETENLIEKREQKKQNNTETQNDGSQISEKLQDNKQENFTEDIDKSTTQTTVGELKYKEDTEDNNKVSTRGKTIGNIDEEHKRICLISTVNSNDNRKLCVCETQGSTCSSKKNSCENTRIDKNQHTFTTVADIETNTTESEDNSCTHDSFNRSSSCEQTTIQQKTNSDIAIDSQELTNPLVTENIHTVSNLASDEEQTKKTVGEFKDDNNANMTNQNKTAAMITSPTKTLSNVLTILPDMLSAKTNNDLLYNLTHMNAVKDILPSKVAYNVKTDGVNMVTRPTNSNNPIAGESISDMSMPSTANIMSTNVNVTSIKANKSANKSDRNEDLSSHSDNIKPEITSDENVNVIGKNKNLGGNTDLGHLSLEITHVPAKERVKKNSFDSIPEDDNENDYDDEALISPTLLSKASSLTHLDNYITRRSDLKTTNNRAVSLHEDSVPGLLENLSNMEKDDQQMQQKIDDKQASKSLEELDGGRANEKHMLLNKLNRQFANDMVRKAVSLYELQNEKFKENVAKFEQKFLSTEVLSVRDGEDDSEQFFPRVSMENCSTCASCRSRSSSYHSLLYDMDTANMYPIYQPTVVDFVGEHAQSNGHDVKTPQATNLKNNELTNGTDSQNANSTEETVGEKNSEESNNSTAKSNTSPSVLMQTDTFENNRNKVLQLKTKKDKLMKQGQAAFGTFKEKWKRAKAKV